MAAGLFGLILGLAGGMLIYGGQLDRVHLANRQLQGQLESLQEDLERLRARPEDPSRPVQSLSLRFLELKDDRLRLEMNRLLRNLLVQHVVGTPVREFDPLLVAGIVEGRLFPVEGVLWRVEVEGAYLVWDTCILYLRIHREGEVREEPQL